MQRALCFTAVLFFAFCSCTNAQVSKKVVIPKEISGSLGQVFFCQTNFGLMKMTADRGVFVDKKGRIMSDNVDKKKRGNNHITIYCPNKSRAVSGVKVFSPTPKKLKVTLVVYKDGKPGKNAKVLFRKVLLAKEFKKGFLLILFDKKTIRKRPDMITLILSDGRCGFSRVYVIAKK